MEDKVKEQKQLEEMIQKLLVNMKKDAAARKTQEYLASRKATLQQYWDEFKKTNEELKNELSSEHNYFKQDFYGQVEDTYRQTEIYIQECQQLQLSKTVTAASGIKQDSTGTITSSIQKLTDEQNVRKNKQDIKLKLFNKEVDNVAANMDKGHVSMYHDYKIRTLGEQWKAITDLHEEILLQEADFTNDYYNSTKDKLEKIICELHDKMGTLSNANGSQGRQEEESHISLPKITLPTFEGKYENWTTFHDIFLQVIHKNKKLGDAERMQYLKTHLRGEASKLIQHLETSNANYKTAWDMMVNRYSNQRILFTKFVDNLLNLPTATEESAASIKQLHDTTAESLRGITSMGVDASTWNPLVALIITRKLDKETNKLYEQSLTNPRGIQDLEELMDFLEKRFQSLEALGETKKRVEVNKNQKNSDYNRKVWSVRSYHTKTFNCPYCNGYNHGITQCQKFKTIGSNERYNFIKRQRLCVNCLKHSDAERCYHYPGCFKCNKYHHTLLHEELNKSFKPKIEAKPSATSNSERQKVEKITSHVAKNITSGSQQQREMLLATAYLKTRNVEGGYEMLRALIDPGSQASFITENAAQLLALPRVKIHAEIAGLGQNEAGTAKGKIEVEISPRFSSKFKTYAEMLVLPTLTDTLPKEAIPEGDEETWEQYILADPTYNVPGPVDIIIGVDVYSNIIQEGLKKSRKGILAQKTELGWILSGAIETSACSKYEIVSMIVRLEQDQQLEKFWEIEEVQMPESAISEANKQCEEHYKNTHHRNNDGTYTVKVPFKDNPKQLGESKRRAVARLIQLEKRFETNKQLELEYKKFMEEYLNLQHMKIIKAGPTNNGYYIPHQAVVKEDSDTTKLRVVFDASSKTSNGKSLNDMMHSGPRLQQDLVDILLRWRTHYIVLKADVEKMYRQIKLATEDQQYHKIVWRFAKSDPIQEYQLTTVTYGTTSAPYLAVKTLQQLAEDEEKRFPKASQIAKQDFYVDDLLTGADSKEEAEDLQAELIAMFKTGGFNLRKWASNILINGDSKSNEVQQTLALGEQEDTVKKTLGIYWCPLQDVLKYKVKINSMEKPTKRIMLSEIASIFDPLGLLAPIIVTAKLLMQELWLGQYPWDKEVPAEIAQKWIKFQSELSAVEAITVPRWVQHKSSQHTELHGFCDASEKAYGAAIYVRTTMPGQSPRIVLLTAKSKVVPLKVKRTLPKLELCAASLLSKMITKSSRALQLGNVQIYAWTDSMITLAWIKGSPDRWKNFVANRVTEIKQQIGSECWHHVRSEDNPADLLSRGVQASKLQEHTLWWNGPKWLGESNYEKKINATLNLSTNEEEKRSNSTLVAVSIKTNVEIFTRFSSLRRMVRVVAICRRFILACRKQKANSGCLTVEELHSSLQLVLKQTQKHEFSDEITAIKKNGQVEKKSPLLSLTPFLGNDELVRVGGRLQNSALSYDERHPILIPHNGHITTLIINEAHHQTFHGGNQATLAYTRRKYWIINARTTVRQVINNCITCTRHKAIPANQLMGNLPAPRVTPSIPFTHTGIDYAGPLQIRMSKGRGNKSYKGYIAIFICLATKAIHIEAVSDMTSNAFIAAVRRFTARRGQCSHIYSDNGTTFVGATKILDEELRRSIEQSGENLTTEGVQWHFIPPASPHFGGLWEAGVKSIKYHLKRVVGDNSLTFEELSTLLYQVEACLNSRPLLPVTNDPNDNTMLTPAHFLIGKAIITPPETTDGSIDSNHLNRWKVVQKMKRDFWKSWSSEYLSRLQQRTKWKKEAPNIKTGEIVIIKDENISPNNWPLARIAEVHPGKDGIVRVVTVQTKDKTFLKRPVTKVCILPVNNSENKSRQEATTTKKTTGLTSTISKTFIFLTLLSSIVHTSYGNFTMKQLEPGLYIEHVGFAKINRGIFRIGVNISKTILTMDEEGVNSTAHEFSTLCDKVKELTESKGIHCEELVHHVVEQQKQILWNIDSIRGITHHRTKRGLLGRFLTTVFGVNEEVYKDIDNLDQNQQHLIQASNHQTKLMLSTMVSINDTEARIAKRLENFRVKLNQGLQAIKEMKLWYRAIDINKLNIDTLTAFQLGTSYLQEISDKYSKLLDACFKRSHLYEFITPSRVAEITKRASQRLPSNMVILATPIYKMDIKEEANYININGYFHITEPTKYDVIKATPIPKRMDNGIFVIMDISTHFIAVDYNHQKYFEVADSSFENSIPIIDGVYLCTPTVIRNIETNPNCVIDHLYHRVDIPNCVTQHIQITSLVWKELTMVNTWLFITKDPTRAAVICNGIREDVVFNNTGLIQVSPECIIETKRNTLHPKTSTYVPVLASYSKNIPLKINTTFKISHHSIIKPEAVLKPTDSITTLVNEELNIQHQLNMTSWHSVHTHSTIVSSITTILVVLGCVLAYITWTYTTARMRRPLTSQHNKPTRSNTEGRDIPLSSAEEFLLPQTADPVYSAPPQ